MACGEAGPAFLSQAPAMVGPGIPSCLRPPFPLLTDGLSCALPSRDQVTVIGIYSVLTISLMSETFCQRSPASSQDTRSLGSVQGQPAMAVLIGFPRKVQKVQSHPHSSRPGPLAKVLSGIVWALGTELLFRFLLLLPWPTLCHPADTMQRYLPRQRP